MSIMNKLIIGLLLLCFSATLSAQTNKDSLWTVWSDTTQSVVSRLEAIGYMSEDEHGAYKPDNLDTAFYHAQLQYDLAKAHGLKRWMGEGLLNQGNYFNNKGKIKQAFDFFTQAEAIALEVGNKKLIGASAFNLGLCYLKQADFANAISSLTLAAATYSELGNERIQSQALGTIGSLYFQQQKHQKCIDYLTEAIAIREELIKTEDTPKDRMIIRMMKETVASTREMLTHLEQKEAKTEEIAQEEDPAKEEEQEKELTLRTYGIKGLSFYEEISLEADSMLGFIKLGHIALERGHNQKAKQYFELGIAQVAKEHNNVKIAGTLNLVASEYLLKKDSVSALPYLVRCLALAKQGRELGDIGGFSNSLYHVYKATGQYKKSLEAFQLFIIARDSISNLANATAAAQHEIQTNYDQQKTIDDLENDKQLAIEKRKKETQAKLTLAVSIGLLLISLLTLLVFNRLKVTRRQKLVIEEQKEKLEQSEKHKEQFLANMSHEIRTPMHAISGMVKILERNETLPAQKAYFNAMRISSNNLVVILNDVLDLSKIQAGKLDIQKIPMQPVEVLENVTQTLEYKAADQGLVLAYSIGEDVPKLVQGDPVRLNQILTNLVGNAIKFTPSGRVDILLEKVGNQLQFSIKDTGIGISPAQTSNIFKKFEQASNSTTRHYGGTGLGLSISKQLVELQNGTIRVESEEGKGSTFFVQLPIVVASAEEVKEGFITKERLKKMAESLKGIRILLAEDNAFNQMIAQDDLSYYIEDISIEVVGTGVTAIAEFTQNNYDLVLMDVQMPEMDGLTATRQIRQLEADGGKPKGIPIIAMTASLLKYEIDSCYDAGMNGYIPKPYQIEELIGSIHKQLHPDM
jgi:signal transduction histidine kinase